MNPLAIFSRARPVAVRWTVLYETAKLIYTHGRRLWDEYTPKERTRLGELVRKSKGRRANLTEAEQRELWELVKRAAPWS